MAISRMRGRRLKRGARCARARRPGWARGSRCSGRATWSPPRLRSRRRTSRTTPTRGYGATCASWRCSRTGLRRRSRPSGLRFGAACPTTSGPYWGRSGSCSWSTGDGNTRRVRCGAASSTAAARTCVTRSVARFTSKATPPPRGIRCSRLSSRRRRLGTPRRSGCCSSRSGRCTRSSGRTRRRRRRWGSSRSWACPRRRLRRSGGTVSGREKL
mmetsp:Transcript_9582/g.37376  ORF Transcript_9582/g.37376 Transcript_9582/m.37376 type:complete len:214 (-) Transcript_9582:28-669(-)